MNRYDDIFGELFFGTVRVYIIRRGGVSKNLEE